MAHSLSFAWLRVALALIGPMSGWGAASLLAQSPSGAASLPPHHALALEVFRELIETDTTLKTGSTKAVMAIAARLKAAGFTDAELTIDGPRPQNQNLIVRLRGKGLQRPVLFIGHLDVVEAFRADWTMDPFTLIEKDGYFYGRGTTDMKNADTALIVSLIRMKQAGYMPRGDIIVALTDHEEGGEANGMAWLVKNRRELIDAEYCINPDGGGGKMKLGKPMLMQIQTAEKAYLTFQLEVTNKGGHGSVPVKDNAIYRLAAGLNRLAAYDFPIQLNETTRTFFARSALQETGQTKADMLAVAQTPSDLAAAERLAAQSASYNAMLRTTCVATMLSGGHAANALPQMARAVLNGRVLPGDSPEAMTETLKTVLADDQIKITRLETTVVSPISPLRPDLFAKVEQLTTAMWPGVPVTPIMSTGATDGKYLRSVGIPVYGVSGTFINSGDMRAHGRDERLGVQEFYRSVDFMHELIKMLTQ
ncbi:MAG: M20/M25/M40 family metallo-hydrolase [Opitutaceae bacterium]|jgi:acetylornithine deacetylase/succinyl-diaminopimelate desuccinylase-like protein